MRPARPSTGYLTKSFPPPFSKFQLLTNDTIKSELFASFELISEVKAYGKKLLRGRGHTNLAAAFTQFQGYVRQAKLFYEAADALNYRASPLLYYYSFMNFAKSYVLLCDPSFVDSRLAHGLSYEQKGGGLRKQTVIAKQNGVFPLFYRQITKAAIQHKAKFNIKTVLSYITDVAYEFSDLKLGQVRCIPGNFAILHNAANNTSHSMISFASFVSRRNFDLFSKKHLQDFERVNLSQEQARKLFGLSAETVMGYEFFESKKIYPLDNGKIPVAAIVSDIVQTLEPAISYYPFEQEVLFYVNLPIPTPVMKPYNEIVAIYCMMFYLGSLVRYRPQFLESLLETQDAWIIERFIKQAPITFLRHLRNAMDEKYIAYVSR